MVTAIDIKTELWNEIISLLSDDLWSVSYKYDYFDAGIDFDLIILKKKNEVILFGWDNWFEGEIQCSEFRMNYIESLIKQKLKKGSPSNLKPEIIELFTKKHIKK